MSAAVRLVVSPWAPVFCAQVIRPVCSFSGLWSIDEPAGAGRFDDRTVMPDNCSLASVSPLFLGEPMQDGLVPNPYGRRIVVRQKRLAPVTRKLEIPPFSDDDEQLFGRTNPDGDSEGHLIRCLEPLAVLAIASEAFPVVKTGGWPTSSDHCQRLFCRKESVPGRSFRPTRPCSTVVRTGRWSGGCRCSAKKSPCGPATAPGWNCCWWTVLPCSTGAAVLISTIKARTIPTTGDVSPCCQPSAPASPPKVWMAGTLTSFIFTTGRQG